MKALKHLSKIQVSLSLWFMKLLARIIYIFLLPFLWIVDLKKRNEKPRKK